MTLYKLTVVVASETPGEEPTYRRYEMRGDAPNDTVVIPVDGGGLIVTTGQMQTMMIPSRDHDQNGINRIVHLYPLVALKGMFEDMPASTGFVEVDQP